MGGAELEKLREQFGGELKNIMDFWAARAVDEELGGFCGRIGADNAAVRDAEKSAVLNTRILWTFSAAYRATGDGSYLKLADRAFAYIKEHLIDSEHGGVYWMLDCSGNPVKTKKQVYAQAFAVYGLAEYFLASGSGESLDLAIAIYQKLERYAWDAQNGGYLEALAQDWAGTADMQLSKNALESAQKSMNTHLHVLEAYTNLYRAWKDEGLKQRLEDIIEIMRGKILDGGTHAFKLFFDRQWTSLADIVSYGHDIEGSWLLCEAAEALGDEELLASVRETAAGMARQVLEHGLDREFGGLYYEREGGKLETRKVWWVQAEAVVGLLNAHLLTGEREFRDAAVSTWEFTRAHVVAPDGEWHWQTERNGAFTPPDEKAGPWKCPYHNSRMCMQGMLLLDEMMK